MAHQAIIVVQARVNSTRLLGKILLPLGSVPMLVYLIRRLKVLPPSYLIVVATTKDDEDALIVSWAEEEGVKIIRGEKEDVLARYIQCIETFPADIIVRVTADNPLTDPRIITGVVKRMQEENCDYVGAIRGYPLGIGVDAFSNDLLRVSFKNSTSLYEREHINAYVLSHQDEFKTSELAPPVELSYPNVRLTVDTYDDYKNIKHIVDSYPRNHFIQPEDAIERAYKRNI